MPALSLFLHLLAAACLAPLPLAEYFRGARRAQPGGGAFWGALAPGVAAPLAVVAILLQDGWRTGFALNLWASIATIMLVYAGLSLAVPTARRLGLLLMPYLIVLALLATVWAGSGPDGLPRAAMSEGADGWFVIHIVLSLLAYAAITLAAVSALGVSLQERALKRHAPTALSRRMPAVADGEALTHRLLIASAALLGLGVATGMATLMVETGQLFVLDHKTLLTALALVAILALVWARGRYGLRGRKASHYVLSAYLLITLGYPGVKFVGDVLMG